MAPKHRSQITHLAAVLGLASGCANGRPIAARPAELAAESRYAFTQPLRDQRSDPRTRPAAPDRPVTESSVVRVSYADTNEPTPADGSPPIAPPAPADVMPISLATLESWALQSNPAIRQASAAAQKAMGYRDQVGLAPNPTVGFFGEQIGDAGTDQYGAFVSQDIVLGDKLGLSQNVLSHGIQSQLWEVESQRFRVLTDVRLKFYEAFAAQQRLEAATAFQAVLDEGVRIAELRMQAAEGTRPEILLARIQRNELDVLRQQAAFSYDAAWKELAATVGNQSLPSAPLAEPSSRSTDSRDWDAVYQDLVSRSPELKTANAMVCRAAANVERQQAQPIPNLQLEVGVGHDLATNQEFARVQAGLPVPLLNKNGGNIAAADAEYCRATQNYRRLQLSLKARLARAAREYDSARVAFGRYQNEIVPQAEESLKLSEEAYAAGEFGFLQVLTARRTFFDAQLQLIDARRDLAQAAASVDGLLLSGGLDDTPDTIDDDGLRGQALSGQ